MARSKPVQVIAWADLGVPSLDDALGANAWAFKALVVSMHKAMNDLGMDERERRREMREIATAMRGLIPQARLRDAEEVVRGDANALNEARRGPEMEDAAQFVGQGSRPKAKRGRPRKRQVR